jgi:hypothetical protein
MLFLDLSITLCCEIPTDFLDGVLAEIANRIFQFCRNFYLCNEVLISFQLHFHLFSAANFFYIFFTQFYLPVFLLWYLTS